VSSQLKGLLERAGVKFRILEVPQAATSFEAAASLGLSLKRIGKSVVLQADTGETILVVVRGDRRIDQGKLAKMLGYKKLRLATAGEVVEATGYAPGGVPPIGHARKLPVYVDEELLNLDSIYVGGGDERHLLEIPPSAIVELAGARVIQVPKKPVEGTQSINGPSRAAGGG
jgi:Cys-tRNA(Pro) deacylase